MSTDPDTQPDPIDWDSLDPATQHELVSLATTLGKDDPEESAREVTRRGAISGALGAAGAAALGGYATGRSRADSTQAGTIGDGNEDWNIQDLTADSATTGQIVNALESRDEYSTGAITDSLSNLSQTVTISGADFEVLTGVPRRIREDHKVNVDLPDDPSANILIPATIVEGPADGANNEGAANALQLRGDQATPTNASINSISAFGVIGTQAPRIFGVDITGTVPLSDENAGAEFYGCQGAALADFTFANSSADNGIIAYGSHVNIFGDNDLGTDVLDDGLRTKHGGSINCRDTQSMTGNVLGYVARNLSQQITLNNVSATGNSGKVDNANGVVVDYSDDVAYLGPLHIETGTAGIDPGAASDNTTDTQSYGDATVTFAHEYDTEPNILVNVENSPPLMTAGAVAPSASGFTIGLRNYSTTTSNFSVDWIAIG